MTNLEMLSLALLFVAVSGLAFGLASLLLRPRSVQQRLDAVTGLPAAAETPAEQQWPAKAARLAAPLARLALPKEGWEEWGLRTRFMNAGLRQRAAPVLYFATKAALAIVLPALFILYAGTVHAGLEAREMLFVVLLLATFGYYLPNGVLARMIAWRQRDLLDALPDAIDLMIVCVEAGLGLDAAIVRAGEEIRLRCPALADELQLVGLELRLGAARERALRNFALRTGLDDVSALVAMLVQADRFGTSIADSLRVHADGLRTRRRLRAEEAAAKIPLKLLFPLIFFVFPSLMLVLLGPAAISIYRVFLKSFVEH